MANKKLHGEHNQDLCHQLFDNKKYFDWVVTTAFYSAIHFVEDFILPCDVCGATCKNIYDVKSAYNMPGRHASRERLVFEKISPSIGARYKWLDDNSRNARYTTYKITIAQAEKAKQYLSEIKKACYPEK